MRAWLTTGDCARLLGVSREFVRGEVRDGRIAAEVVTEGRQRKAIRIYRVQWRAYLQRYWPLHPCSTGNTGISTASTNSQSS